MDVGVGVLISVVVEVGLMIHVPVGVAVEVGVGVTVTVLVAVGEAVFVPVGVGVRVGVDVGVPVVGVPIGSKLMSKIATP